MRNGIGLSLSLFTSFIAGLIGLLFTMQSLAVWYPLIKKPFFTPPNSIYAPVWIMLYILVGISFFLFWTTKKNRINKNPGYIYYFTQLVLNVAWFATFFGLRFPVLGALTIVVLLGYISLMIIQFAKVSKIASWLLLPYFTWIGFATILNVFIVVLNY